MLQNVDHIDIRVSDLSESEAFFKKLGLIVLRRLAKPRNSIEMALPGPAQVVFELKQIKEGEQPGIAHVGFKATQDESMEALARKGLSFTCTDRFVPATGRTVSNITGFDTSVWQITK